MYKKLIVVKDEYGFKIGQVFTPKVWVGMILSHYQHVENGEFITLSLKNSMKLLKEGIIDYTNE
jgi:hypothetical protein